MVKDKGRGIMNEIIYTIDNTKVIDSYKITDIDIEVMEIIRERHRRKLPVTREFDSYVREWKAHNNMYNLHLFRSHTKDVDLEENQKLIYKIIYWIIGR